MGYFEVMQPFRLKIGNLLQTPRDKRFYNEKVFGVIAPKYDFITRALSFWKDAGWKEDLIRSLPLFPQPHCLDIACGTGDLAFMLAGKYPAAKIMAVDITEEMLVLARQRNVYPDVSFSRQDMCMMDIPDESIDIATGGYALRNAPDLAAALQEVHRVLKPGGIAAFLDFSKPPSRFLQCAEYALLKMWTGFWGIYFHRNHEVYSYIAESLSLFPDRVALRQMLKRTGFDLLDSETYFFGITERLLIRKNV